MSKKLEWAEDYLQKVAASRERARKQFENTGELPDDTPHLKPVIIQSWLEELAKAIVEDEEL